MALNLDSYRVISANIVNEKEPAESTHTKLSYQYGIRIEDETHCSVRCICSLFLQEEENTDDKSFYVEVVVDGIFTHSDMNDPDLRRNGAAQLFPLLRSHIATLMAAAGMDPIVIPISQLKDFSDIAL